MARNQYVFPPEYQLAGSDDPGVLATLEYKCITCDVTCGDADSLSGHVGGAKHEKNTVAAGRIEDPTLPNRLGKYKKLEEPCRQAKRTLKQERSLAMLQRFKAFKESKTKEELKEYKEEKKRKLADEGSAPQGKKKRKLADEGSAPQGKRQKLGSWTCACCNGVEVGTRDDAIKAHIAGRKHAHKQAQFEGGCWLCGELAPQAADHFSGPSHKQNVALLQQYGINVAELGVPSFRSGGGGQSKAQKKTGVDVSAPGVPWSSKILGLATLGDGGAGQKKKNKKKGGAGVDVSAFRVPSSGGLGLAALGNGGASSPKWKAGGAGGKGGLHGKGCAGAEQAMQLLHQAVQILVSQAAVNPKSSRWPSF